MRASPSRLSAGPPIGSAIRAYMGRCGAARHRGSRDCDRAGRPAFSHRRPHPHICRHAACPCADGRCATAATHESPASPCPCSRLDPMFDYSTARTARSPADDDAPCSTPIRAPSSTWSTASARRWCGSTCGRPSRPARRLRLRRDRGAGRAGAHQQPRGRRRLAHPRRRPPTAAASPPAWSATIPTPISRWCGSTRA